MLTVGQYATDKGNWTDLLPEQVGGKTVDYTTVAAAWEVQRRRRGLENEGELD